jgi:Cu/Ag efflux pump CusA
MMMLAGMVAALVVIIDDAVVDVDNIAQRLRQHGQEGSDKSAMSLIVDAVLEMRGPLGFALLIILLAVLPLFFLPGLAGSFIQPVAVSYILAIISSLLVALIVTPALSVSLLSEASLKRESPIARGLGRFYHGLLARTVRSPYAALIVAAIVIVAGLVALPFLDVSLLPALKQNDLLIGVEAAPGTSRMEMNRITAQASDELRTIPGVRSVGSHVGRAITGDAVVGINSGEIWVSIDSGADYEATVAAIEEVVDGYPGLAREVQTYQPERIGDVLAGSDTDLVVRVYGHELDILREKAQEVALIIAEVDGIDGAQAIIFPNRSEPRCSRTVWAQARRCSPAGDYLVVRHSSWQPF